MKDYPANVPCINTCGRNNQPCSGTAFLAYPTDESAPLYICRSCGCWFHLNSTDIHPLKQKK